MRLIQLYCDGDKYFINPDKIKYLRTKKQGLNGKIKNTLITFIDSEEMIVDHEIEEVVTGILTDRKARRNA